MEDGMTLAYMVIGLVAVVSAIAALTGR